MSKSNTMFLQLQVHWEGCLVDMLHVVNRFPKSQRFIWGQRISNLVVDIAEDILEARFSPKGAHKKLLLEKIDKNMSKLSMLFRLSHEMKYVSTGQLELIAKNIYEAGKMVGGWKKSTQQ